ncbi:MAG TPA: EF-hand domain-containing protein [Prosthecobacter sp.]|nr:EF-hand domain-containing protein [Prosthecobacter sp.]
MKSRYAIIHGLSMLTLGVGVAMAQEGERKAPPAGGDGGGRAAEYLKRADTDSDGKISKEEFVNMSKTEAEERFSKADGNSDGFVDTQEITSVGDRLRDAMRTRGGPPGEGGGFRRPGGDRPEGAPSPEGGFRRPPGERPEGSPPPPEGGRPAGGPPGAGGPQGGPNMEEIFGRMDKNADGTIDKDEYTVFSREESEQRFGRMDGDADGKLSKEEMRTVVERMRGMMRGPGGPGGPGAPGGAGGGFRRPGGEGGEGGFRRPPSEGGEGRRPEGERPRPEGDAPKKDAA